MMRVGLSLRPGQPGTKGLLARYGKQLVRVRYRYDERTKQRMKTVERGEDGMGSGSTNSGKVIVIER